MATATTTLSVIDVDESRRIRKRVVKIVVQASPATYLTGGLTMDLTGVSNPQNLPAAKFGRNPTTYALLNGVPGYTAVIVPGAALTNWKIKFFQEGDAGANTALVELTNALAIPAAISGFAELKIAFSAPKNL